MANPHKYALEPAAQAFVEATATPPFLFQLPPEEGRAAVEKVQDGPVAKPDVQSDWIEVPTPTGPVRTLIMKPPRATGVLPVVFYTHGAGWVFGSAHTHDALIRDLCVGSGAALVFPEYTRAPDAKYPTQNEQCYAVAQWVVKSGAEADLDGSNMVIAGDSVGGNMAIVLNLLAEERRAFSFKAAILFYPVTDANFDTPSYKEFATGYFLAREGMQWFWDQYTTDPAQRREITASPLRASVDQLRFFPPTLLVTGECDVLRDQGEAFGANLRRAGVDVTAVRYGGTIHDFVMVNSLHETAAAKEAIRQAVAHIRGALGQKAS